MNKLHAVCEPWPKIADVKHPAGANVRCLLADVLPGQHFAAGLTLKAAQVPLSVQRKEGLSVLDVSATSCAICETQKCSVCKKKKI